MLRQLTAFLLLITFLTGHIGLVSAKHYCGSFLAAHKIGLLSKAPGCGMEDGEAACEKPSDSDPEKSCCHDDVEHLKADTELQKISGFNWHLSPAILVPAAKIATLLQAPVFHTPAAIVFSNSHSPPHTFSSLRFLAFLQLFLI